jgi:hypothetical protein
LTVPYCEPCDRFYNPNTLDADGDCPAGHHVAEPTEPEPAPPVPWHFKLMLALLVAYLTWRFVQFAAVLF